MTTPTRRAVLASLTGLAVAPVSRAFAQGTAESSYPVRNITLVVPFAPGGSTDILARIVAGHLQQSLGQPVVIENRTGASGNIGTATVARAVPDGYTFLFNTMSVHTMNRALFASMPFDGVKDFSPIAMLAYVTNTMVVHPSVPAKTVPEFIAHAKANPGKVAYASAGPGSTNHLCAALFEKMTGVQMVHVPYRGGAPAVADTVSGQTQLFFTAGTQSLRARQGRQAATAGRDRKQALVAASRCAYRERDRSGLRDVGVVRRLWARRHAACDRCQAERRNQPDPFSPRREEEDGGHRGRSCEDDAGGIDHTHAQRRRKVGQAHQGAWDRRAIAGRNAKLADGGIRGGSILF
jgi:tripartite-type tricarboxylate transporter receptor subunit TctC